MDWSRATIAEVDGAIDRLRQDLSAQVAMEHDAVAARERAMGQIDAANADIKRCRQREAGDLAEIGTLIEERQRLIPKPREEGQ